jgi:hypothetical protein
MTGARMKLFLSSLALAALPLVAQTATSLAEPTTTPYQYFMETGLSYDYFGKTVASTTGFGVRIGQSNAFSVTDIDTPIGQPGTSFATMRTAIEYHVAAAGLWEFLGLGSVGVTTSGTTTVASFSGGVGISFDLARWLTKGKISLPVIAQDRLSVITANQVKPTYLVGFRKTW